MRTSDDVIIFEGPGDSRTLERPEQCTSGNSSNLSVAAGCPVPFGLSSGVIEPGTDHARANGLNKGLRFDLACKPWCLFNLTDDIGERHDLGGNPAYQSIAKKIAARLAYHGSTGPMPAYIWPTSEFAEKVEDLCVNARKSGYVEPLDLDLNDTSLTLLDSP